MSQAYIVLQYSWTWVSELVPSAHLSEILHRLTWLGMSTAWGTGSCCNYCSLGDAGKSPTSMKLSNFTLVLLSSVKSTELPFFQRIFLSSHDCLSISLRHLQNLPCAVLVTKLVRAIYGLWSVLVDLKRYWKPFQSRHCLCFSTVLCRIQPLTSGASLLAELNGGRTAQALF